MDRPDNEVDDLADALDDIRLTNRYLGGRRALLRGLAPYLASHTGNARLEILDVGTGGADLPVAMVRHARRVGLEARVIAVDLDPGVTDLAARAVAGHRGIRVIRADASSLPFRDAAFDVVTASMFLHHFDGPGAVRLLAEFRRVARHAVVINDLRRHLLPWGFIYLAARLTRRAPMYVHDAPLSVLRGFTDQELVLLAREAGARELRVDRHWPFRLVLTLPGSGNGGGAS
jgi:SAM-dependent methyltransferase